MSRSRRAAATLGLVLFGVTVGLLLAEVAVRWLTPVQILPVMFQEDSASYYSLVPSASERSVREGYFDYRWTTNGAGFRARSEFVVPRPRPVRRVLALGDSFTFGVAADDDETYPALLERRLRLGCADPTVEVINGGVGGFGTSNALARLESRGLVLEPSVVIVGFVPGDLEDNVSSSSVHELRDGVLVEKEGMARPQFGRVRANSLPGYAWLSRHSALVNLLRRTYGAFLARGRTAAMGGSAASADDVVAMTARGEGDREQVAYAYRLTQRLLERVRDTAAAHGGRLLVALIPQLSDAQWYYAGTPELSVLPRLRQVCLATGLECVDAAVWLVRTHPAVDPTTLYIPGEYHPTKRGYALIAQALEQPVARLLGCPAAAPADSTPP